MDKGEIVVGFLFPAHEKAASAMAPAVRALDDPAAWPPAPRGTIFAAATQMEAVTEGRSQPAGDAIVVALVETKAVSAPRRAPRLLGLDQSRTEELVIIAVGARHDDGERDPAGVGGQAQLGAAFAAVGRIGPGFFPHPKGPWSCSHRY